jgi:hypothetical protein
VRDKKGEAVNGEVERDAAARPDAVTVGITVPEPDARAELRGWVWLWMYRVAMQGNRTLNPRPDELPQAEAVLFAIALR